MMVISPYISEGSGLKQYNYACRLQNLDISPYISEGSGLKLQGFRESFDRKISPLTSVRGAD